MITVHLFREGGGLEHRHDLGLAEAWRGRNGSPLWIDVEDPGEEEARDLADVCGFHPLTVEDCLTPAQPPKVEEFGDYLFLVFRGLRPEEGGDECAVESYKLAAFLGAGTLVTVHKRPVEAVKEVSDQVTRKDLPLERHMDQILHAIVDRMVDRLLPVVDRFEERIEEIEEQVFRDPKPGVLRRSWRTSGRSSPSGGSPSRSGRCSGGSRGATSPSSTSGPRTTSATSTTTWPGSRRRPSS